jgi:hypothetical protein
VDEGFLARAVREIGEQDPLWISSDTSVDLIRTLAEASLAHAEYVLRNHGVKYLVALLRPAAPSKFHGPALRTLVVLSRQDDRALRLIVEGGAVPNLIELMYVVLFPSFFSTI